MSFVSPLENEARHAGAFDGVSCLLAAPTNAGKSYLARKLLRHYLQSQAEGHTSVFLCPFKALADEMADELEEELADEYVRVVRATSDYADPEDLGTVRVLVATYEKFASLFARRTDLVLHTVVADEVHLVADPTRGPRVEALLTSLSQRKEVGVRLFALSAVVSNADTLAEWLGLKLVKLGDSARLRPLKRLLPAVLTSTEALEDYVRGVVDQDLRKGLSVLIADPSSRDASEKRARALRDLVKPFLDAAAVGRLAASADALLALGEHHAALAALLRDGVAYHHAALEPEARRIVERAFRGDMPVLCCSPTLSAGVNMPAHRVLLCNPCRRSTGPWTPIGATDALNTLGRAGRYDSRRPTEIASGIAQVVLTDGQSAAVKSLLAAVKTGEPPPVASQITGSLSSAMELVLWSVALGGGESGLSDLGRTARGTLWARSARDFGSAGSDVRTVVGSALDHDGKLGSLTVSGLAFDGDRLVGTVTSEGRIYTSSVGANGDSPRCEGPQRHAPGPCKHIRAVLRAGLLDDAHPEVPAVAFRAATTLVSLFATALPPAGVLDLAVEVLVRWGFLERRRKRLLLTDDGRVAASSWVDKARVYRLRDRIEGAPVTASPATVVEWVIKDFEDFSGARVRGRLAAALSEWTQGEPPARVVGRLKSGAGLHDFLQARDFLAAGLATYEGFARARGKDALVTSIRGAQRRIELGVPEDSERLAALLPTVKRDRVLALRAAGLVTLEALAVATEPEATLARAVLALAAELQKLPEAERARVLRRRAGERNLRVSDLEDLLMGGRS